MLEKNQILPEDLEPDVGPFEFYIQAFYELESCRQFGMGLGPIPFTAILQYFNLYDVGDFDEFLYIIRKMDSCVLELESKKQNLNAGKNGRKSDKNNRSKN